jgi:hypothetical protein
LALTLVGGVASLSLIVTQLGEAEIKFERCNRLAPDRPAHGKLRRHGAYLSRRQRLLAELLLPLFQFVLGQVRKFVLNVLLAKLLGEFCTQRFVCEQAVKCGTLNEP